jgi:hypothetical protein
MEKLKPHKDETKLQKAARIWANGHAEGNNYSPAGALKYLAHRGCQSGIVSHMIYYTDTVKFYKRHREEINEMLYRLMDDIGFVSLADMFGYKFDEEDPLCLQDHNMNLLAWFGFEEAARIVAEREDNDYGKQNRHPIDD